MISVDPLREGKRSDPISMPPCHFKHTMGALKMKWIPLAGQDVDWIQKSLLGDHERAPLTAVNFHE